MKHCKHYLLFLLAGALLLLPVTSHYAYAISWDDIRAKISNFFSEERFQKIIPGAIITFGLAGALYYWWTKKGGGGVVPKPSKPLDEEFSDSESSEVSLLEEPAEEFIAPSLKQFNVYSQFNNDGGGAASCGYQTLFRGMQVAKAKYDHESDEDLQNTLNYSTPIEVYFGKNGGWRKDIIEYRKYQELKKILHAKLLSALVSYGNDKAIDLYRSALGFLEDNVIAEAKDPERSDKSYDFTNEALLAYIQKSLGILKNKNNEDLIIKLRQPDEIARHFDFDKMRALCFSKDFILSLPKLMEEVNNRSDLQEDFVGDWLSDGELEYLWKEHRIDIIPFTVDCGFKAIANFELVNNPEVPKEFDEVATYVDENIKPLLNQQEQMFQIFALGTMRQTGSTTGTRGHWYPLIMYQDYTGKRHYYIMDSAGNRNRLKDENAWKIINLIERSDRSI